ncbi:MAG: hypothetical protein ACI94Y_002332 [Maribacter sp.]|jgi:hypothetical protein
MSSTDQEITLKDFFLKLGDFYREVKSNYLLVILCVGLCLFVFGYKHFTYEPHFKSELRFVVEGQNGGGGGLSNLLGSFGFKKGGKVNPYKVLEVAKSNKIFRKLIKHKTDSQDLLGNDLINTYGLLESWKKDNSLYSNFKFEENSFEKQARFLDLKAIKEIKRLVFGSTENINLAITTISFNEDTGIYSIVSKAKTEEISIDLTSNLYLEIKDFFENAVFENQKQLAEILNAKSDSIKNLRDFKTRQLAIFEDRNRGVIDQENQVRKTILSQESFSLNLAYGEILKSKEMADVNLKDLQPLFLAIDFPHSPLNPTMSSLIRSIILSLFFGCFSSILFIIFRKIYKDTMSS